MKKGRGFKWKDQAQLSFEQSKSQLSSAPVLASPDYARPFLIQCDASKLGVGAVLERATKFQLRASRKAESNYSLTEQESLAVLPAIKKFRPYVEGQQFCIVTDHASLKWSMGKTDLSGRLARWALKIQGFKFEIKHRRGVDNVVPDCLSRQNFDEVNELDRVPLVDTDSLQFKTPQYLDLANKIKENESCYPDLRVHENKIYKRTEFASGESEQEIFAWKLWIPESLTNEVIKNAHVPPNKCHGGVAKTLERIRRNFYWPKMTIAVRDYVARCKGCKENKSPNFCLRPPMTGNFVSERPFQRLYIDIVGPYPRSKKGNIGLLVVLDHLTKFPLVKPLKKLNAQLIGNFLQELFATFGVPEFIVSDNGQQFRSRHFQTLLEKAGVKHTFTALYSPQANASERINRTIVTGIRTYVGSNHQLWDNNVPEIMESIRSSIHQSTGFSPYYLLFGQQMASHGNDYAIFRALGSGEGEVLSKPDKIQLIRDRALKNIQAALIMLINTIRAAQKDILTLATLYTGGISLRAAREIIS